MSSATPPWFASSLRDVHSQCGEDGVIERVFQILGEGDRTCVEFGAWDGKHLSNTRHLVEQGWSAVLIEGDPARFEDLRRVADKERNITPICAYVDFEGPRRLDALLARTSIPKDFSLLSIDIDGNDYHVWDALVDYRPRVVVIEFNPSIPADVSFAQPRDNEVSQGSSLLALVELGKRKGYELVASTAWNAFFVRAELLPAFGIADNSPAALWTERKYLTRLYQLFDGTLVLDGCDDLLWHETKIGARRLQVLPKPLRRFIARMSPLELRAFRAWKKLTGRG